MFTIVLDDEELQITLIALRAHLRKCEGEFDEWRAKDPEFTQEEWGLPRIEGIVRKFEQAA